jgi:hypothetical protein
MYFANEEEERDAFALFGEIEAAEQACVDARETASESTPQAGFSWVGFLGGLAALVWIAGAAAGSLLHFGAPALMAMAPAMQAGLVALALGPALLFWATASAAGEALKARRLAAELIRIAHEARAPFSASEDNARRLGETVHSEIENLNLAVSAALDRLTQLENAARRQAAMFKETVLTSRAAGEQMWGALKRERDALDELTGDMRGQTETMANAIARQVRLMREASKLVKTDLGAAEEALETHLSSFASAATLIGERTAEFHAAAHDAADGAAALNTAMHSMLEGLGEATRLTDAARQSADKAVIAANETAAAVRETTRSAVFEAKRAAQLVRAETANMQEAAAETLAKLRAAAQEARAASGESEAAAARHAASAEKRLHAFAADSGAAKKPRAASSDGRAAPPAARKPEPAAAESALRAAASAAIARAGARGQSRFEEAPKRAGFGWGDFMAKPCAEPPAAANQGFALAESEADSCDAALQHGALDLVCEAGVDLGAVLRAPALERIAASARLGASARRRAVAEIAPTAVSRILRHVERNASARELAAEFRARPDLATSEHKGEGSDLVRAYLLIDTALA